MLLFIKCAAKLYHAALIVIPPPGSFGRKRQKITAPDDLMLQKQHFSMRSGARTPHFYYPIRSACHPIIICYYQKYFPPVHLLKQRPALRLTLMQLPLFTAVIQICVPAFGDAEKIRAVAVKGVIIGDIQAIAISSRMTSAILHTACAPPSFVYDYYIP